MEKNTTQRIFNNLKLFSSVVFVIRSEVTKFFIIFRNESRHSSPLFSTHKKYTKNISDWLKKISTLICVSNTHRQEWVGKQFYEFWNVFYDDGRKITTKYTHLQRREKWWRKKIDTKNKAENFIILLCKVWIIFHHPNQPNHPKSSPFCLRV